ncbi:hypothetical protein [Chamaesiphon minutus]|uniref:hypothetical protein n=1 Tax=Chamaesiphon minutus TaxID=1173032 RepID=UPI001E5EB8D8|nr:hypothetical protein [Chamaesiphon minutus]
MKLWVLTLQLNLAKPLHRYRKFKKTRTQERADRIATLAKQLDLPRASLAGNTDIQFVEERDPSPALPLNPFQDPDPYREFTYPTTLMAKLAIADYLGQPLAKLAVEHREFIAALVEETLTKKVILERVRAYFQLQIRGEANADCGILSVLLAGHPKLKNDLRRPTMEEIGSRSTILNLEGMVGSQREYITWLIDACGSEGTKLSDVLTVEAVDILSERLRTPLQIQQHLMLAMEAAYQAGEKPVTGAIVESVLSKQIDELEPKLTRHGYDLRGLAEQFHAKPAEIKLFFRGQLVREASALPNPARTKELTDQMLIAGLPI